MDMLCMYSSQAHVIFDEMNVEDQFLECLTFCLLKIALYEKFASRNPLLMKVDTLEEGRATGGGGGAIKIHGKLPSGYVPGSLAMMKSGANRLWIKMLEYKKTDLQRLFQVELPTPGDNHHQHRGGALAAHLPPQVPGIGGNKTFLRYVCMCVQVVCGCCFPREKFFGSKLLPLSHGVHVTVM